MRWSVPRKQSVLLLALGVGLLVAGAIEAWRLFAPRGKVTPPATFDLPPLTSSPFRNTSAGASYAGIKACAECHPGRHRSWLHTAHSRALGDLDPTAEPPDTRFVHAASGQTERVYRDRGQLRHRSAASDGQGEFVVEDHPIRYLVGSGHHTRSYLIEVEGFLSESPLTWYASRRAWGMSPGYDRPNHRGFERAADGSCLFCHVGRLSSPEQEYQRLTFAEQSIGCERCHGPGSLHVSEERAIRAGSKRAEQRQPTIVHPGRLSRSLREAICSQCHLNADSAVVLRGRRMTDFRPGLPLADFCINYRLDEPDSRMKVVGHVDQLHLSRCYRASAELTCTTCHDPHATGQPGQARQKSVKACLGCHADPGCKLPRDERLRRSPANDCVTCYMPRVDTKIQHVAFTHHRIGVHSRSAPPPPERAGRFPNLVALDDESRLSALDRDRNLGLAYFGLSQRQADAEAVDAYRQRAMRLLSGVRSRGLPDGEVAAALARLSRGKQPEAAVELARDALRDDKLSPKGRVNCLFLIAEVGLRTNRLESALQALEQLTTLRRLSQDYLLLGICRERQGDRPGALRDFEKAAAIAPFRPDLHDHLARAHELLGNSAAARRERSITRRLQTLAGAGR